MLIMKYNGNLTVDTDRIITAQTRKTGMFIYATGTLTNNGEISMTARGAHAEGQNVYLWKNEYIPSVGVSGGGTINIFYNKNINSGTISAIGGKGDGNGGDGSITLQDININSPTISVNETTKSSFKINVDVNNPEIENIKFDYYINDKIVYENETENNKLIEGLQDETRYKVKVIMNYSDNRIASPELIVWTLGNTGPMRYPLLTSDGMMNIRSFSDTEQKYYYEYDESLTTTDTNPLPINCYDRDKTTYSTLSNGIDYKIEIDESIIGKYVSIYCQKLNDTFPYGYITFYASDNSIISSGYLQNLTGESANNLSVKSVEVPDGTKYIGIGSGTSGGPTFNIYDIWCSDNDNLTGTKY